MELREFFYLIRSRAVSTERFGPTGPVGRGPDGVYHAAACGDYHFVSYDLGQTWEDWGQVSHGFYVSTWTFDPSRPERIWAGMRHNGYPVAAGGWVYLSEDGGRTWRRHGAGIEVVCGREGITRKLVLCPSNPDVMAVAIYYCGLLLSWDGGASWQPAASPPNMRSSAWTMACETHETPCEVLASWSTGLYQTLDSGATWALEVPTPFQSFFANPYQGRSLIGLVGIFSGSTTGFELWERR
jgi:photosystem II stability/assembly factor-like uncharacterized protein